MTRIRTRRKKSENELVRNREYQKDYYADNRSDLLQKKADRYKNNPDYRESVMKRARRRHWLAERKGDKELPPFGKLEELTPKGEVRVLVADPEDVRNGQEVLVPVFSTGDVAVLLGRAPEVLRLWWKRKQIPEPHYRGSQVQGNTVKGRNPRLFTLDEMRVLDEMKERLNLPSKEGHHALFTKAVQEAFDGMHLGLTRKPRGA